MLIIFVITLPSILLNHLIDVYYLIALYSSLIEEGRIFEKCCSSNTVTKIHRVSYANSMQKSQSGEDFLEILTTGRLYTVLV